MMGASISICPDSGEVTVDLINDGERAHYIPENARTELRANWPAGIARLFG